MQEVTQQPPSAKITEQTFVDLGMWLTYPNEYNAQQLATLLDDDARLPLINVVNTYWLGGALYNSLKNSNVWQKLDQELQDYLAELEQFYRQRNEGIKQEAIFSCQLLTDANIPVVILKGSASLFNGVFNPLSNRFMTDVDLLVPEDKQQKANKVLMSAGYTPQTYAHEIEQQGHHHAPALFRKEGGHCCVELHRWALKKSVKTVLTTEEVWEESIPLALTSELNVLQMDATQQIILSVAHSELSHNGYQDNHIDWRQLFNLYTLIRHHNEHIDWPKIQEHFSRSNKTEPLAALLFAAFKFLNLTTPITSMTNKAAIKQINICIALYVKRQSNKRRFKHLITIIKGYSKESIIGIYGEQSSFSLLRGRFRHFKRHLLMASDFKTLKRFINNVCK